MWCSYDKTEFKVKKVAKVIANTVALTMITEILLKGKQDLSF